MSLLFDARASNSGKLQVYFRETEAVAVGASGLGLIASLAIQALFFGALPQNWIVAWTVLDLLWFLANLGGLWFFVARSLDFMHPARRERLVQSYLANTAWRFELGEILFSHHWQNVVAYGHLPAHGDDAHPLIMPLDLEEAAGVVTRTLRGPHVLADVRLGILEAVLDAQAEGGVLSLNPIPGLTYKDETTLARSRTGRFSDLSTALVRRAFVFAPKARREGPPSIDVMLLDGANDVATRMAENRYEEFRTRLREVLDLHALAFQLAQKPDGESYAALGAGSSTLSWEWARAYRDLFKRAAEHLVEDGRFFESCAFLPSNLIGRLERPTHYPAIEALFFLPALLVRHLVEGAVRRHVEALPSPPPRGTMFSASGPGRAFYHAAWHSFVGGWESLAASIARIDSRKRAAWPELVSIAPATKRHLRETALFAALAAKGGERHAIGWTTDLVLKWHGKVTQGWRDQRGYALRRPLPTLALTQLSWSDVVDLPLVHFREAPDPWDVFGAVIENAWVDTLVVLVSSLVTLFGPAGPSGRVEDGAAETASAIFTNKNFDPGASTHPRSPPLVTDSILQAILRMTGASRRFDGGYGNEIGALADMIDRLEGPSYINLRFYSTVGEADVQGQTDPQIMLLAASLRVNGRRRGAFAVDDDVRALLLPELDESRRDILEHLGAMREAVRSVVPDRGRAVVATLRGVDCDEKELQQRLDGVDALLASCELEITQEREKAIRDAQVDPVRLAAVADAAAERAFSPRGDFPLPLVGTVELTARDLPSTSLRWGPIHRGQYTTPLMGADSIDAEYWAQVVPPQIGEVILRDALSARPADVVRRPRSSSTYWANLKSAIEAIRAAGQTPIIVRPSRNQPDWLWQWHHQLSGASPRPDDMRLERRESSDDSYDFHLNDVAVYSSSSAGSATLVFGTELLEKVSFQRRSGGRPVTVRLEEVPSNPWRAVLVFDFGRQVTLGGGPLWKIVHPKGQ